MKTKNTVQLRSKSDPPDSPDPQLTFTRPRPRPELDNKDTVVIQKRGVDKWKTQGELLQKLGLAWP